METFFVLLALCAGNSPVPGEFPSQRPVTRSFDVIFDLRLNKRWVNNREAGDLRRHRAHWRHCNDMMRSWNALALYVTGPLWREFTYWPFVRGIQLHRPLNKPEQAVEKKQSSCRWFEILWRSCYRDALRRIPFGQQYVIEIIDNHETWEYF